MTKSSFCTVGYFEAEKEHEAIDWESIKDKYKRIKERFIRNFPDGEKSEEYPHSVTVFTGELITSKIKLRSGYRKALDAKSKSGGGRLILKQSPRGVL